jgi:hydroxyethylthiazole kinase
MESNSPLAQAAAELLQRLRQKSPLIHCYANFVSMDLMANALLASGASPAMVHALEEASDFTSISSGLLVNLGTLSTSWLPSVVSSIKTANSMSIPWILDPVGCGATKFRTSTCREIALMHPTVIRGNASEIMALSNAVKLFLNPSIDVEQVRGKGVDSTHGTFAALNHAKDLAKNAECVVAVSGEVDIVTNGEDTLYISNGLSLLQKITAAGCALTAIMVAFLTVRKDTSPESTMEACASAFAFFGLAADLEASKNLGPGSLRVSLLDNLYSITPSALERGAAISSDVPPKNS